MAETKFDNANFKQKVDLRTRMLMMMKDPIVMETNGGAGAIFTHCYRNIAHGAVFETAEDKSGLLAMQRPSWSVYECDAVKALSLGVGSHLEVNFLDVDPYGECWPFLDSYFSSPRTFVTRLAIAVNCGLRQKLRLAGGWHVKSLQDIVERRGNQALYKNYLDICKELLQKHAWKQGYRLKSWTGYYTGNPGAANADNMTHFGAIFEK